MPRKRAAAAKAREKAHDPDPDPDTAPPSAAASDSGSAGDIFWAIRGILAEKKVKGCLVYKVDWEDHPETGEKFPPSWV